MAEDFTQVNVNLTSEDVQKLDIIAQSIGLDNRSACARWIIRQQYLKLFSEIIVNSEQPQPNQG